MRRCLYFAVDCIIIVVCILVRTVRLPYGPVFVVSCSGQLDCLMDQVSLCLSQGSYALP